MSSWYAILRPPSSSYASSPDYHHRPSYASTRRFRRRLSTCNSRPNPTMLCGHHCLQRRYCEPTIGIVQGGLAAQARRAVGRFHLQLVIIIIMTNGKRQAKNSRKPIKTAYSQLYGQQLGFLGAVTCIPGYVVIAGGVALPQSDYCSR